MIRYFANSIFSNNLVRLITFGVLVLFTFDRVLNDLNEYASYMPTWSGSKGIGSEVIISIILYNLLLGYRWLQLSKFNQLIFGGLFNFILAHSLLTNNLGIPLLVVFSISLILVSLVKPFRLYLGGKIMLRVRTLGVVLFFLFIFVVFNGKIAIVSPLDTVNVYSFRGDNSRAIGSVLGRILAFLAYSGLPLLLFKAKLGNDKPWLITGVLLVLLLYFSALNRMYLMSIVFLALSYGVLRKLIVLVLVVIAYLPLKVLLPLKYGIWSRLLFTPSETILWYRKFAEVNTKDYSLFSDNRGQLAFDVAEFATQETFSFNGGYLAIEGIFYGGLLGIFVLVVLTSVIFQNLNPRFNLFNCLILLGMPLMAISNTSFFTSLLTGGVFFLFVYINIIKLNESPL